MNLMRKILTVLFLVVFITFPALTLARDLAQDEITNFPVGTCRNLFGNGDWQQMPDGTWAAPNDELNTCRANGMIWNFNSPYSPWGNQNQYNPQLANMDTAKFFLMCILLNSLLPQAQCQGYSPYAANYNNQFSGVNSYLNYPSFGRDYIAIGGRNSSIFLNLNNSKNKWTDALIGVGMGWLLDRLTS